MEKMVRKLVREMRVPIYFTGSGYPIGGARIGPSCLPSDPNANYGYEGAVVSSMQQAVAERDVAEEVIETSSQDAAAQKEKGKTRRQPRYNVVLWNDDDHTYDYVVRMMKSLFGHSETKGVKIAVEVDTRGKAICLTTTMEHAELKRDQIHAFGRDHQIQHCTGSMWASIEPVPSE